MEDDLVFLVTIFDLSNARRILPEFEAAGIKHRIVNKSALTNFRVPMSTYVEMELWVPHKDIDAARRVLNAIEGTAAPD
jgi:hypothetical protein